MASLALTANAQSSTVLRKPRALQLGDKAALITPSTAVTDPDRLELAEFTVRKLALVPIRGRNVGRYFSRHDSIKARVDDLHEAFSDDSIRAVFAIRGGYGSAQLLDTLDFELIGRNPKVFAGYSDITALHLAIHQHTGLVTFHSPVLLSRFTDYTLAAVRRAFFDTRSMTA